MKKRLMIVIFTGLLLVFPMISRADSEKFTNRIKLICEDGEEFSVKEGAITETANIPYVKDDLILIDTNKLRLNFYSNGKISRTYPVAIGDPETPSPIGEWKIIHKGGNWGDGFGVRWIGINVPWGIYGIHGTNKPWTIGSHASHGCIRMFNSNVLELYNLVKVGTPVHIIGQIPKVVPRRELIRNNTGRDIVAIQFAMRNAGFNPGVADGRFGIDMEQAVIKLQRFYGLATNGKITPNEQILLNIR